MKSRASSASKSKFKIPIGFLVAGVVALAAAVMIKSGAGYAVQTRTTSKNDSVSLVINTQCAFASSNVNGATAEDGTYEATGMNGGEASWTNNKNVRAFNIACNQLRGYDVFAYATDLDKQDDEDPSKAIAFVADVENYEEQMSSTPGRGIWTAVVSGGNDGALLGYGEGNETKIKTNNGVSLPTGDEFTVTYRAYIGRTTESGTYSGEAVYTLTPHPLIFDYQWTVNYALGGGSWNRGLEDNNKDTGRTDLGNDTTVKIGMYEGSQEAGATAVSPTKAGHTFLGWGTEDAPTTVSYQSGDEITLAENEVGVAETLYAVWDEDRYTWKVNFHYNDGSSNKTTQTNTESVLNDATVTLDPPTGLTWANHTFLGWSTNSSATVADANYAAGRTVTIAKGAKNQTKELDVYAVWKSNKLANGMVMQNADPAACAAMDDYETVLMLDNRAVDGNGNKYSYQVRKMKDGNCWMVQNLALPGDRTITNEDSDLNSKSSYTLKSSSTSWGSSNTDTNGWMWDGVHQEGANVFDVAPGSNNDRTKNTGAYYSYVVATAGYAPSNSGGDAPDSICPRGWKLPKTADDATQGGWESLYKSEGSNTSNFNTNFKVAFTGYCYSSNCPYANGYAYYWSRSIYSATSGYYLVSVSGGTGPSSSNNKYVGYSVRCVLIAAGS